MRTFITGHRGYVGRALIEAGFCSLFCDVTDPFQVERAIRNEKPDLVLHLAGKNNVDWCQKKENEKEVINVNMRGTANVFETLEKYKIPGVLISTDQIWRGGWFEGRYKEDAKLTPPVNFYGSSKLASEIVASEYGGKIVRTSFLFERNRMEISEKMTRLYMGKTVEVPVFIRRSFLYLPDFVFMLSAYCKRIKEMPPVLHLSGAETVSWYTFMKELAEVYGFNKKLVQPRLFDSRKYVPRPHNGGLNTELAASLGFGYRDYKSGLRRMKNES